MQTASIGYRTNLIYNAAIRLDKDKDKGGGGREIWSLSFLKEIISLRTSELKREGEREKREKERWGLKRELRKILQIHSA